MWSRAVERRCAQVVAIPTDDIGPSERGKGEYFASPKEMEGDGYNFQEIEKRLVSSGYGGYIYIYESFSHWYDRNEVRDGELS